MISNDRQYRIAKSQVENFRHALDTLAISQQPPDNVHPLLMKAQHDAIEAQMKDLVSDIAEYEELKAGLIAVTEVNSLKELPLSLIKARIANGLTQAALAEKAGLKMQQIQRYEAEEYETASVKTLIRIAELLNITINADVQIKEIAAPASLDVKNYPFKDMFRRKWFGNFSGTYNEAVIDSKNLLEKFFEYAGLGANKYLLTRKMVRAGSTLNNFALEAWYAQVLIKARSQQLDTIFRKENITEHWLRSLAIMSIQIDHLPTVSDYLHNAGIRFVIESHLEGTFLDGAAFLMEPDCPVIAMTLRHDRLDNFWFVLFHELAHILLHLSENLVAIFDNLDVQLEGIEKEADDYALNALIPNEVWRKSLVRFNPTTETIANQAKSLGVHTALVAGRIRKETGKYFQFAELVGQGEVRKHFIHELKN